MIHFLHERAADAALNASASLAQARLCLLSAYSAEAMAWFELYRCDKRQAEVCSSNAGNLESLYGSVFPGVSP